MLYGVVVRVIACTEKYYCIKNFHKRRSFEIQQAVTESLLTSCVTQSFQNKPAVAGAPKVATRFNAGYFSLEYQNIINDDNSTFTIPPATFLSQPTT